MSRIEPFDISLGETRVTVRAARGLDGAAVISLLKALSGESDFLVREPDEIQTSDSEEAQFLERKFTSPVDLYLVAEVNSEMVGIGSLTGSSVRRFAHEVTLALAVRRSLWGQGLGSALIKAMLSWADNNGVIRIALEVVETNTHAIRLYHAFGFVDEGRLRAKRKHGNRYLDNYMMARVREHG